ncbi:EF-hand and coiled-coil domain-containing protein 1 [Tupaia chinensis]|uniref:EF-hand and coiled-coil domain-containing protein 1 n=1 Tax=Tupaia chinensis TaxID=246437 RepID=UPI000FFC63DF|nr:EF-hand and coiled-coil domain-containing protein 1 [Tupaia chinensis]
MDPGGQGADACAEGEASDPYRRPARRTQWLLSALAHHYGLDRGVENEIVVLATGLDQYLQEVFHHLDCRGAGRLVGLWKNQAEDREVDRGESEGAAPAAEARAGLLRRGQAEMRRRAEKARQAVLLSLPRVRELEALARQVPDLRCCVQRLEAELRGCRLERPTLQRVSPEPRDESGQHEDSGAQGPSPGGAWPADSSSRAIALDEGDMEDQLFRSVEGQAASDQEEEEAKVCCEGQRSPASLTKTLLAQLSSCMSRPDDQTAQKLRTHFGHFGGADHTHALGELEAHVAMLVEKNLGIPGEAEPEWKKEENEHLRLELQVVETERVRLSLMEEKLVDVLQLLQRLRDLNISKRALGKILLSTLDACRDPAHERRAGPSATLDALYQALAGCKLLQGQPSTPTSAPAVLNNPLLISC